MMRRVGSDKACWLVIRGRVLTPPKTGKARKDVGTRVQGYEEGGEETLIKRQGDVGRPFVCFGDSKRRKKKGKGGI